MKHFMPFFVLHKGFLYFCLYKKRKWNNNY